MNETTLLNMLGKAGEVASQTASRKKSEKGDFASQFMAMLFQETAPQAASRPDSNSRTERPQAKGRAQERAAQRQDEGTGQKEIQPRQDTKGGETDKSTFLRMGSEMMARQVLGGTGDTKTPHDDGGATGMRRSTGETDDAAEAPEAPDAPGKDEDAVHHAPNAKVDDAARGASVQAARPARSETDRPLPQGLGREDEEATTPRADNRLDRIEVGARKDAAGENSNDLSETRRTESGAKAPSDVNPLAKDDRSEPTRLRDTRDVLRASTEPAPPASADSAAGQAVVRSLHGASAESDTTHRSQSISVGTQAAQARRPSFEDAAALKPEATVDTPAAGVRSSQDTGASRSEKVLSDVLPQPLKPPRSAVAQGMAAAASRESEDRRDEDRPEGSKTVKESESRPGVESHTSLRRAVSGSAGTADGGTSPNDGQLSLRHDYRTSAGRTQGKSAQSSDAAIEDQRSVRHSELETAEAHKEKAESARTQHASAGRHDPVSVKEAHHTGEHAWTAPSLKADLASSSVRAASSHTAHAASGSVDFGKVVGQIVETAVLERGSGLDRFTVQLRPEFLGRIQIETELADDATMRAVIRVEDPSVRKTVETGLTHLVSKLNELGLDVSSARVADFPAQNEGQGQQQPDSGSSHPRGRQAKVATDGFSSPIDGDEGSIQTDDGSLSYFA